MQLTEAATIDRKFRGSRGIRGSTDLSWKCISGRGFKEDDSCFILLTPFDNPALLEIPACITPDVLISGSPPSAIGVPQDMPTIVPLTPEAEWLPAFVDLVLAPHPDDETLGAGGLIAKLRRAGVPVTIVAITDGENAYAGIPRLGDIRVLEQSEAVQRLGVPAHMIHRLHLPDRDVSGYEDRLADQTAQAKPSNLATPAAHRSTCSCRYTCRPCRSRPSNSNSLLIRRRVS